MTRKDRERFWAKVKVDPETGCWVWTAAVRTWKAEPWDGGYGAFSIRHRAYRAHIVAYWILFGCRVPRGKVLLHGCDNRRCVNVLEHVRPGTQIQNIKDMLAKGRATHQRKNGTIGGIHGSKATKTTNQDRPIQSHSADAGTRSSDGGRGPGPAGALAEANHQRSGLGDAREGDAERSGPIGPA